MWVWEGSQALTARCPGSPIPKSSSAGRAPGSRPRSSCSRGLRASSKIASREGTCVKASATPGVQPGSPHLGPLSRHPAGCPELGAERPRRPGAEEPARAHLAARPPSSPPEPKASRCPSRRRALLPGRAHREALGARAPTAQGPDRGDRKL